MVQRVNFSNLTNLGGVADPALAQDAASKNYVDTRPGGGTIYYDVLGASTNAQVGGVNITLAVAIPLGTTSTVVITAGVGTGAAVLAFINGRLSTQIYRFVGQIGLGFQVIGVATATDTVTLTIIPTDLGAVLPVGAIFQTQSSADGDTPITDIAAGTGITGTLTTNQRGRSTVILSAPGVVPGGSNTQIQFNNNGVFGGSSALTWNGTQLGTNAISAGVASVLSLRSDTAVRVGDNLANYLSLNASVAGTSPSISTVGSDTNINLIIFGKGTGGVQLGALTNQTPLLVADAAVQTAVTPGVAGMALLSAGPAKTPYWGAAGGVPGGATTQVQFNNAGVFGGSANLTWNGTQLGTNIVSAAVGNVLSLRSDTGVRIQDQLANFISVNGSTAGGSPTIATQGADTNINLIMYGRGTGGIQLGTMSNPTPLIVADSPTQSPAITLTPGTVGQVLTSSGVGKTPYWGIGSISYEVPGVYTNAVIGAGNLTVAVAQSIGSLVNIPITGGTNSGVDAANFVSAKGTAQVWKLVGSNALFTVTTAAAFGNDDALLTFTSATNFGVALPVGTQLQFQVSALVLQPFTRLLAGTGINAVVAPDQDNQQAITLSSTGGGSVSVNSVAVNNPNFQNNTLALGTNLTVTGSNITAAVRDADVSVVADREIGLLIGASTNRVQMPGAQIDNIIINQFSTPPVMEVTVASASAAVAALTALGAAALTISNVTQGGSTITVASYTSSGLANINLQCNFPAGTTAAQIQAVFAPAGSVVSSASVFYGGPTTGTFVFQPLPRTEIIRLAGGGGGGVTSITSPNSTLTIGGTASIPTIDVAIPAESTRIDGRIAALIGLGQNGYANSGASTNNNTPQPAFGNDGTTANASAATYATLKAFLQTPAIGAIPVAGGVGNWTLPTSWTILFSNIANPTATQIGTVFRIQETQASSVLQVAFAGGNNAYFGAQTGVQPLFFFGNSFIFQPAPLTAIDAEVRKLQVVPSVGASALTDNYSLTSNATTFFSRKIIAGLNTYWDTDATGAPRINANSASTARGWIVSIEIEWYQNVAVPIWLGNNAFPVFLQNGQVVTRTGINSTSYLGNLTDLAWDLQPSIRDAQKFGTIYAAWHNSFADTLMMIAVVENAQNVSLQTAAPGAGINPTQSDAVVQALFNVNNTAPQTSGARAIAFSDITFYEYQRAVGGAVNNPTWQAVMTAGNAINASSIGTPLVLRDNQATPNQIALQTPASITANYTLTLPTAQATVAGQTLSNDGTGILAWVTPTTSLQSVLNAGNTATNTGTNVSTLLLTDSVSVKTTTLDGTRVKSQSLVLDGSTSGSLTLRASPATNSYTLTLPNNNGGSGQVLINDGSGNFSWQSGLGARQIRAISTVNVSPTGTQTVDGITPATNDIVLLTNQTDTSQQGLYLVNTGGGWIRLSTFIFESIFALTGTLNSGKTYGRNADGPTFGLELWQLIATTMGGPLGLNTQFQYNSAGVFAGTPALTYDATNARVSALAPVVAANLARLADVQTSTAGLRPQNTVGVLLHIAEVQFQGTYTNNTGVGTATLVGTFQLNIAGVIPLVGSQVLLVAQTASLQNGSYNVTANSASAFTLTRTSIIPTYGNFFVSTPTNATNYGVQYENVTTGTIIVGTTAILYAQFGVPNSAPGSIPNLQQVTASGANTQIGIGFQDAGSSVLLLKAPASLGTSRTYLLNLGNFPNSPNSPLVADSSGNIGYTANISIGNSFTDGLFLSTSQVLRTGAGNLSVYAGTTAGNQVIIGNSAITTVNRIAITASTTGVPPTITTSGDVNASINIAANGTGAVNLGTNQANFIRIAPAASGSSPVIIVAGDANATLTISATGTGAINLGNGSTNFVRITGAAAGANAPVISAAGGTDIPIAIKPAGPGHVFIGNTDTYTGLQVGGGQTTLTALQAIGLAANIDIVLSPKGTGNLYPLGASVTAVGINQPRIYLPNSKDSITLGPGTAGQTLFSNGTAGAPYWGSNVRPATDAGFSAGGLGLSANQAIGGGVETVVNWNTGTANPPTGWTYGNGVITNTSGVTRVIAISASVQVTGIVATLTEHDLWIAQNPNNRLAQVTNTTGYGTGANVPPLAVSTIATVANNGTIRVFFWASAGVSLSALGNGYGFGGCRCNFAVIA